MSNARWMSVLSRPFADKRLRPSPPHRRPHILSETSSSSSTRAAQFFWTPDGGRSESSLMGLSETSRRPGRADETSKFRATGSQNVVHGALGVVLERRKLSTFIKSQLLSPEKLDSGLKSREEAVERQSARALVKARLSSLTSITSINELSERPPSGVQKN